jgi:hypothetical protein
MSSQRSEFSFSKKDHEKIDIVELMEVLKSNKHSFGFMEFFFAGVIFASKSPCDLNPKVDIIDKLTSLRAWTKKMELSTKQKSLFYQEKFCQSIEDVQQKEIAEKEVNHERVQEVGRKRMHEDCNFDEVSAFDDLYPVIESQKEKASQNSNKRQKIEEEAPIKEIVEIDKNMVEKKSKDQALTEEQKIDKKADEKIIEEAKHEVVGECPICLDEIEIQHLHGLDNCTHLYHQE